jgi:hypothetical protein
MLWGDHSGGHGKPGTGTGQGLHFESMRAANLSGPPPTGGDGVRSAAPLMVGHQRPPLRHDRDAHGRELYKINRDGTGYSLLVEFRGTIKIRGSGWCAACCGFDQEWAARLRDDPRAIPIWARCSAQR